MPTLKRKILFTSHTANFHKFNRAPMRMLRGKLEAPYDDLNIGGWSVDYASANEEKVYDVNRVFEVDFARNPLQIHKLIKSYSQLKTILRENNYDAIHTHTPVGSVITRLAAKSLRKKGNLKVIYTCHGFHFYKGAPKLNWLIYYSIEKMMARYTDLLITINTEDYECAKKHFSCPVKLINGVGIDTTKFNTKLSKSKKASLRKEIGLKDDDFTVVYVAEFTKNKNHKMLLESIAGPMHKNKNLKLVLLGVGKMFNEMRVLAKKLDIDNQVLFLGYRNDVHEVLQCCDLCISTSIREGLGLGVLEAILCGCSVLISNNRGHRDIVDGNKKYMFELGDNDALEKKIINAIKNPEEYSIKFSEKFSLRSSLATMREIYEELLG